MTLALCCSMRYAVARKSAASSEGGDCGHAAEDGEAGSAGAIGEGFAGVDNIGGEGGGDLVGRAIG